MAVADEGGVRRWGVVYLGLNDKLGEEEEEEVEEGFLMSSLRFEFRVRVFFSEYISKTFRSYIHYPDIGDLLLLITLLKIFDAEVMINGEGFTQRSGTA